MTEHGGRIQYERSALGGAAFVLILPVISIEASQTSSTQIMSAPSPGMTVQCAPRVEKILVVDDEKAIVEMLGEMLGLLGFAPTLCHSGCEGLKRIGETEFDLVLSDLRMPEMDGSQFYRRALEMDARLKKRFIFLTGDTAHEDTRSFLKESGQPFLTKPFRLASIEEVIRKTLRAA
jgi:CheY-like chemotaxis protein